METVRMLVDRAALAATTMARGDAAIEAYLRAAVESEDPIAGYTVVDVTEVPFTAKRSEAVIKIGGVVEVPPPPKPERKPRDLTSSPEDLDKIRAYLARVGSTTADDTVSATGISIRLVMRGLRTLKSAGEVTEVGDEWRAAPKVQA